MNAFTQKPDLSNFMKKMKHSENVAALGRRSRSKPTPVQRLMFNESHADMAKVRTTKEKQA